MKDFEKYDTTIVELYPCMSIQQIADKLQIKHHTVANRVKSLKKSNRIHAKFRSWAIDDTEFLKSNYLTLSTNEIATRVNRTNQEVITKASQLKIRKTKIVKINNIDGEIWKNVTISDLSKYKISNIGRVATSDNVLLATRTNEFGYVIVSLTRSNGKPCIRKVHRLVALAFIKFELTDISITKATVNHEDLNKLNNSATNLTWMSRTDNLLHAIEHGANTLIVDNTKASMSLVISICKQIVQGMSNSQICDSIDTSSINLNIPDLISRIRNKKAWVKVSKNYFN